MKKEWISWLYVVLMVCVIYEHLDTVPDSSLINALKRPCIPLFAALAGFPWYGLLKRTKGVGIFYSLKLFIYPYLFWSLIYVLLNTVVLDVFIRRGALEFSITDFFSTLFMSTRTVHLWFLIALIYVMATHIFLRRLVKDTHIYNIMLVIVAGVAFILHRANFFDHSYAALRFFGFNYMGILKFFTLGMLFAIPKAKWQEQHRWQLRNILPVLLVFCVIARIYVPGFYTFVATAFVMLVIMTYPNVYAPKWVVATLPYTMGIYVAHLLFTSVVGLLMPYFGVECLSQPISWICAMIIYFLDWFFVWCIRRIPFMCNVV